MHISAICQNSSFEIRRCKFEEYCYFLHKENENENSVTEIRIKIEDNQKKIDALEKQIGDKDDQITNLVLKIEELNTFTKEYLINKVNKLENIL